MAGGGTVGHPPTGGGSAVSRTSTAGVPESGSAVAVLGTPTDRWLAAAGPVMPALGGPAGTAERLLLLVHYGIDWDSWVGRYRGTYWDRLLPDRVICATYRAGNLRRWWREVSDGLCSAPRSREQRVELETLLRAESLPVLEVLRFETEALLLRTRIVAEAVRAGRGQEAGLR